VWMGTYEEMLARMEEKMRLGFRCIKLKIGAIDFNNELALIRRIRERFSKEEIELRVDANGAFSPEDALNKLEQLAKYDIHSIEQPIKQHQWEAMAELCRQSPLPIALDEELIGVNDTAQKQALLDTIRPAYIILKPSLHGGMCGTEEWIRLANERNIGSWITSALESNIGLNAIAHLTAHIYGSKISLPQGLGTGALFTDNIPMQLEIRGDELWHSPLVLLHTSGSTGKPKPMWVEKKRMEASARLTCSFLSLHEGDTALLCLPTDYIAGKMMQVRAELWKLRLTSVKPSGHPLAEVGEDGFDFAAMVPMQVYNTLQVPTERERLKRIRHLIIGGGAIDAALENELKDFPNNIWATYGMTETLSHIALRRVNGKDASLWFSPMKGVSISLNEDNCLVIDAPTVSETTIITNDIAELSPDKSRFRILGRKDNVICSGGIKIQIEEVERTLKPFISTPFLITKRHDKILGEAVTMLIEASLSAPEAKEDILRNAKNAC
ncbi:MAG: AMP-binding protein, partial [Bacteroidaceae bacterium]|nr:AMP-binding protein [Bacteroidaceae bacterium]